MLLSAAYLPPVEYFALLASAADAGVPSVRPVTVFVEAFETYPKQTYRNRCRILTASGPECLNVPVRHGGDSRLTKDVLVDYSEPWVLKHKRAIMSAYSSSSFYEYYSDGLFSILDSRPQTLLELDLDITRWLLERFGLPVALEPTCNFKISAEDDFRDAVHPKRADTVLSDLGLDRPYWQVFSDKYGFVSGLSAIDLLFNEGPESCNWLIR